MRKILSGILSLENIFIVGLFVSAFVFWPRATVPYELPKIWFVSRWIEVLAIATLFRLKILKKENLDANIIVLLLAFLLVVVITSVSGSDLAKSVVGNYYRGDGLIMLFHLTLLFFVILLFSNKKWIIGFFKACSVSAVALGSISVLQWLFNFLGIMTIQTWEGGYGNFFGNPNFLAGYLLITLPVTAYLIDTTANKRNLNFIKFGIVLQILGIFLTRAWAGYFGVLFFVLYWTMYKLKSFNWPFLLLGLIAISTLFFRFWIFQKPLQMPASTNPESRERIMMKGFLAFEKKPLLGWGWANFDKAFESVDYPFHFYNDVYVDKAHSSFLEILTTSGILGFLAYLLLVVRITRNLSVSKAAPSKYLVWMFIFLVAHMQMNVVSISEELFFWIIAGFSAKLSKK